MNSETPGEGRREPHHVPLRSRREMLLRGGAGFGALALAHLLPDAALGGPPRGGANPMAPKRPHFPPRARNVIFLFMEGGPSHIDLFDPKPALARYDGEPLPPSFKPVILAMGESDAPLMRSQRTWKRYGQSGIPVSDWLPETAKCIDDIAVIRSCVADGINHAGGMCQMNTGSPLAGRPSLGAWVNYGLGTVNQNLPAFVVIQDTNGQVVGGPRNWGSGFMPAVYQGTRLRNGPEPIANLQTPRGMTERQQREKIDFLTQMNEHHQQPRSEQTELDARIRSYELAFAMQAEAPEAVDLAQESEATKSLYGMDADDTRTMGRNCLLARRLVERGVRFVQLYHGTGSRWDAHTGLENNHATLCRQTDKPIAGLLKDLKRRGLLEQTLVIWGGEFGRTPMSEKGDGRDHNPWGFTMWMAGGGVKGGQIIGETDEIGLHATRDPLHVHDLHATVMHLLGVDHRRLRYLHKGRPERVDMNEGSAYEKITTG